MISRLRRNRTPGLTDPDGRISGPGRVSAFIHHPYVLTKRQQCANCCKRTLAFLLSTVGLTGLMIVYTIFGGFVFNHLESPNEEITKHGVRESLNWHVSHLWNLTEKLNVLHPKNWSILAEEILNNYTRAVYNATKFNGWDGTLREGTNVKAQWSFAGSLLYSATVITTIGYGHIAPKTSWGRVATIFYAIVGIPLTLLSITHLGGFMATVFRFLYKNILCGICCYCCRKHRRSNPDSNHLTPGQAGDRLRDAESGTNTLDSKTENNSKNPDKSAQQGSDTDDDDEYESKDKQCVCRCRCLCCCRKKKKKEELNGDTHTVEHISSNTLEPPQYSIEPGISNASIMLPDNRLQRSYRVMVNWRRGVHNALYTDDNLMVQVPIYVSLLMISGYIALGAMLFGFWEEDWTFLIGSYFCFITLSTIGFGDFVPGTSLDPAESQEKLVLCSLYLIFGLALLAMCFDLMQEEARCLFRKAARKIGLAEVRPMDAMMDEQQQQQLQQQLQQQQQQQQKIAAKT